MSRARRRLSAFLTLCGLLLVHGAVAAHACTVIFDPAGGLAPVAITHGAEGDCAAMINNDDAALCVQHCAQGHDANNTTGPTDVPAPALSRFLTVDLGPVPVTASTLAATRPAARSTSPPPLLLSQRLRN